MKRVSALFGLLGIVLLVASGSLTASAEEKFTRTVVASGFNSPTGVLIEPDGTLWVAESGVAGTREVPARNFETGEQDSTALIGNTATVTRIDPDGTRTVVATLPSVKIGQAVYGAHHLEKSGDTLYVATTGWTCDIQAERVPFAGTVAKIEDGKLSLVADLYEFERSTNAAGFRLESDPFGIAVGPDGDIFVGEAGANTLLRVHPTTGAVDLVATFAGMSSPIPNPNRNGQMATDPVPTGVDVDKEGNIFVGFLSGMPFLPGSAEIVKVTPQGKVSKYATNLTMITDVAFGPDGNLYALTFADTAGGEFDIEKGLILRVKEGKASEIVVSGVHSPGALDFNAAGDAYVTEKSSWPEVGEIVMYKGLTQRPAEGTVAATLDDDDDTAWVAPGEEVANGQTAPAADSAPAGARWADLWVPALALVCAIGGAAGFALKRRSRGN